MFVFNYADEGWLQALDNSAKEMTKKDFASEKSRTKSNSVADITSRFDNKKSD